MSLVSGYSTSYSSVVNDTGATVAAVASGNPFYSSPSAEYHQNFFTPSNWSTSNNNWTTAQNEFPSAHQLQNSPPVSCYSSSSPSDYYYHHHQQQQQQQQQIHHQNHYETVSEPYEEPRNQQQQQHQPIVPATPAVRVVRVVKRRNTANKKERRRTMSINNAFSELRDCIPNVPADTKLSKIKTLRLATSYISYLMTVLDAGPESAPDIPFRAELGRQSKSDKMAAAAAAAAAAQQQQQQQQQLYNPNCILQKEQQATNNNNKTEETTMMLCPASDKQRTTSKGRTGWPHHVWALELKQ